MTDGSSSMINIPNTFVRQYMSPYLVFATVGIADCHGVVSGRTMTSDKMLVMRETRVRTPLEACVLVKKSQITVSTTEHYSDFLC